MKRHYILLLLAGAALLSATSARAQRAATPLIPGGDPHAPVNVNADKLEYFGKEQRAVYSGHVLAKQGEGSLRAATLTIFFTAGVAGTGGLASASQSTIDRMEASGPVTITQNDQVGVGDRASYDRADNTVVLNGDVSLTQGPDIVKGDKLIYDLGTGQAQVVGRVSSLFIPGQATPFSAPAPKTTRPESRKDSESARPGKRP